ncbi:MAG: BatA domain-containing protein [Planctomycetaceae bacterium]|nr:BatA domain-containing protein [Planctomycetaceae bacterium]
MSFLNGIFLLALPLAAVPVLLHFYRRQQRDVVQWGAMQFLVDAAKKGRQWERLEELLLMLLRCAAVLALVLALARPQLSGRWFGNQPTREVILVLDNSMSMARKIGEETPFEELQKQTGEIIDELASSDLIQIVLASGGPNWLTSQAIAGDPVTKARLQHDIEQLTPSQGAADLFSSIQAAIDAGATDGVQARNIVVLTDNQAHGWHADSLRNWQQLKQAIEQNSIQTTVQIVPCVVSDDPLANVAVVSIETSHTQVGPGQTITLQAQVQNFGEQTSRPMTLSQLVNGEVTGTSPISEMTPGGTVSVSWKWQAGDAGVFALDCQLDGDDQLDLDNEDSVIVEVVDRVPVLIVEAPPEYRQRVSEATFFTTALGYDHESPHDGWHAVFSPRVISTDELEDASLADVQAVVLTSLTPLITETMEKLHRFVERGGGLWVVLGRRTDREAFSSVWYQDGGGLSPLPLGDTKAFDREESNEEETIHPPSGDHPATAQLSDTKRLDIDGVRIQSRHTFDRSAAPDELSILLETGEGDPLVIEQYVGRGRVIIQTLPFDVAWSNLPLTKAHVVMVNDWMAYLTQPAATQFNIATGARIELPQASAGGLSEVSLITPDGTERELAVRESEDVACFRYSNTQSPGRYEVQFTDTDSAQHSIPFQVARDAQESDLTPLKETELTALADNAGLEFVTQGSLEIPKVTTKVNQRPFWTPLLIGLLIIVVVELLLATRAARSRAGSTTLPSFITTTPEAGQRS